MTEEMRPPKDDLVRAQPGDFELRGQPDGTSMPTMVGHFAVFDQWTEIHSMFEGHFLERLMPGSFKQSIGQLKANPASVRVTFQHGQDPQLGDKVLGPIEVLEEDERGARYEVPLLDTSYNRDLVPGLQAGLYGSSFRFQVTKEDFQRHPERSATNPEQLPERTIREVRLHEFGPVTYPAYAGATAGVRSLTDHFTLARFLQEPDRLAELLEAMRNGAALATAGAADKPHSAEASSSATPAPRLFRSREEWLTFIKEK